MSATCPSPGKIAYRFKAAKQALRRMQRESHDQGRMTVYRCDCGHYHLGHVSPKPRGVTTKAGA